jgi:selenocysteine lyase/cysteine desulfurase
MWPSAGDRIGVASFNVDAYTHGLVAAYLSAEHGIGVRHGCFCAHPLLMTLLGVPGREANRLRDGLRAGTRPVLPGAVRISLGLGSTRDDIDRLSAGMIALDNDGPGWTYRRVNGMDFVPEPDGRAMPRLPLRFGVAH